MNGHFVVADIGGTTLRIARYEPGAAGIDHVRRVAVDGIGAHPHEHPDRLRDRVVAQLGTELDRYLRTEPGAGAGTVGIAFAGPVTPGGLVTGAPTIWGAGGGPVALGAELGRRLGVPVVVVNDITAAVWRYAPAEPEPFCLVTVSSGIGNKVYRDGRVLLGPDGRGGEIGHWPVDAGADAPLCDCGGRGHLGALASGRGALAAARRAAADQPQRFARSALAAACGGDPAELTTRHLVAALAADDALAAEVLARSLRYLAAAVTAIYTAIGICRFIIIGGFALAVGPRYAEGLTRQLRELGCFGLPDAQLSDMVRLGHPDDDHGLIGMGRLLWSDPEGAGKGPASSYGNGGSACAHS